MVQQGYQWACIFTAIRPASGADFTLVLPPYSPELNPVERVWLYLRERFLSLRLIPSAGLWWAGRFQTVDRAEPRHV